MNDTQASTASVQPFISSQTSLPEITLKVTIISLVLTVILAAANAYLGLKVGLTVSASIPAAIMAMGILRFFKNANVLETNIAQTAASAGETLAAGIIFTVPATLVLSAWTDIHYWPTVIIGTLGGVLGVLFSIPVRRALLDDRSLRFPEGTAIGEVLKHSAGDKVGLGTLLTGGITGAVISVAQNGLKVISTGISFWTKISGSLYGIGLGFAPALIGAGFIIGASIAVSILIGLIVGWVIGVPIISAYKGVPASLHDSTKIAFYYWTHQIRYIGIGTNIIGSLWAIVCLLKPMWRGIRTSLETLSAHHDSAAVPRTEKDISIKQVFYWSVLITFIIGVMTYFFIRHNLPTLETMQMALLAIIISLIVYGVGFLIAAVCGYFAGLVGSSASPISCMVLIGTIIVSLVLLTLSSIWDLPKTQLATFAIMAILVNAIIGSLAAMSSDTLQDLKAGQIIGATPWKQQVMLFFGVIVTAFTLPFILRLLFHAYGIAGVFPRPGMDPSQMLLAPQATLIATVAKGVFTLSLPWKLLGIGMAIGIVVLIVDKFLRRYGWHLHVLGVGIGIYLPFEATVPLIIGGLTAGAVTIIRKKRAARRVNDGENHKQQDYMLKQNGLLASCGLVAGAAIAGVVLAIPFAASGSSDVLRIVGAGFKPYADVLGVLSAVGLVYWLYRMATTVSGRKNI